MWKLQGFYFCSCKTESDDTEQDNHKIMSMIKRLSWQHCKCVLLPAHLLTVLVVWWVIQLDCKVTYCYRASQYALFLNSCLTAKLDSGTCILKSYLYGFRIVAFWWVIVHSIFLLLFVSLVWTVCSYCDWCLIFRSILKHNNVNGISLVYWWNAEYKNTSYSNVCKACWLPCCCSESFFALRYSCSVALRFAKFLDLKRELLIFKPLITQSFISKCCY